MLSSRYATGLAYDPQLWSGRYDFAPQNALADAYQPAPAPAPTPAPRAPASAPSLTTGTGALSGNYFADMPDGGGDGGGSRGNADIGSTAQGGITGLGPNPGSLDRSFGQSNYGTLGALAGTALGIGFGVPGLGLAGGALGTFADVRGLNSDLAMMGLEPGVQFGQALANNMSFGMLGTSATDQFGNIMGFDALAEAPLSAYAQTGGTSAPSGPPGMSEAEAMAAGMQSPSFGTGSYGFGTDPSVGGSGNFGAMSAQERGESVGPPDSGAPSGPGPGSPGGPGAHGGQSDGVGEGWGDPGSFGDPGGAPGDSPGGSPGDSGSGGDGYYRGGFTGYGDDGMLNPYEPAGTVHEGEVVIPAHQVERYGLEPLMALVRGDMPVNALAGMMRGPKPTSANALLSQIRFG